MSLEFALSIANDIISKSVHELHTIVINILIGFLGHLADDSKVHQRE